MLQKFLLFYKIKEPTKGSNTLQFTTLNLSLDSWYWIKLKCVNIVKSALKITFQEKTPYYITKDTSLFPTCHSNRNTVWIPFKSVLRGFCCQQREKRASILFVLWDGKIQEVQRWTWQPIFFQQNNSTSICKIHYFFKCGLNLRLEMYQWWLH